MGQVWGLVVEIQLADKLLGIANPREQHSDAAAYEIRAEAYEINEEHCAEAYEINEEQIKTKATCEDDEEDYDHEVSCDIM